MRKIVKAQEGTMSTQVSSLTNGSGGGLTNIASKLGISNPYSFVGGAFDTVASVLPTKGLDGRHSGLAVGLSNANNQIANGIMAVNPVAGMIVKGGLMADKVLKNLGGYTDNITVQDAIASNIPIIGNINGWTGKKADTMIKDNDVLAMAGNSYTGTNADIDDAMMDQGKKFGGLSRRALNRANNKIWAAGRTQNILGDIVDKRWKAMETIANQQDMNNQQYMNLINGGYNQAAIHSAKRGAILYDDKAIERIKNLSKHKNEEEDDDEFIIPDISKFQNGGQMNLIPEGALHARNHHLEDVNPDLKDNITKKGIPVVSMEDGNQIAEIEVNEIILNKELTDKIEELRELYHNAETQKEKDEYAREAGELLSNDIIENTKDNSKFIKAIE